MRGVFVFGVVLGAMSWVLLGSALSARDLDPFEAFATGRAAPSYLHGNGVRTLESTASPGAGPWVVLPQAGSRSLAADGSFRLEGVPVGLFLRPVLVLPSGSGGLQGVPWIPALPIRLEPAPGATAVVELPDPEATPPLAAVDLRGPGGVRFFVLPSPGSAVSLEARGIDTASVPGSSTSLAGDASVAFESSRAGVASVSPSVEVAAVAQGVAMISAYADGSLSSVLIEVDPALDSDGDGMPDAWELTHGFDPGDPADAAMDADLDGLTNLLEHRLGTLPRDEDTDRDLLTDGEEALSVGSLPLVADTDGDFSIDGSETEGGTNPLDSNDRPGPAFTPSFKRTVTLPAAGVRAALAGDDHAYVLLADGRLYSYRIDPFNYFIIPQDNETLTGEPLDVAVVGTNAYVAAGATGIHVVDISVPALLQRTSTVGGLGTVRGVQAEGDYVYAAGDVGLWVLRRSGPLGLEIMGSLSLPSFARLAVSSPYAWLGIPGINRLVVVDVSDPALPREVARLAMPASDAPFRAIGAAGPNAFVAHGSAGLLATAMGSTGASIVSGSQALFPGISFDAVALRGNVLMAHAATPAGRAQILRVADDGRFESKGAVDANPAGASQLVFRQNYVLTLLGSSFSVSEVLRSGDRAGVAPVGSLLLERGSSVLAPTDSLRVRARVRDDVFVEYVDFFVLGSFVLRDALPPYRLERALEGLPAPPSDFDVRATAVDLQGNSVSLGALYLRVEPDGDGDGTPDSLDRDRDGDGVPNGEETLAGLDGFISDPALLDSDGDGVSDGDEAAPLPGMPATDGGSYDTDADGLPDPYEVSVLGTNPARADSDSDGAADGNEDPDSDGLSNAFEWRLATNPLLADTDSDGLEDGAEVALALDPKDADSDGDGILDGDEDADGDTLSNREEVALALDPLSADTDGDALDDPTEIHIGTDPALTDDFSLRTVVIEDWTAVLRGPLRVGTLDLRGSTVTVPAAQGEEVLPLEIEAGTSIRIDSSSAIDGTGKGRPGGRGPGNASYFGLDPMGVPGGAPLAGGSHGGLGGHSAGWARSDVQAPRGAPSMALVLAGGGGSAAVSGGARGGAGGAPVFLRAPEIVLDGIVVSDGESGALDAGAGAGGGIRIECERLADGGEIRAEGGSVPLAAGLQAGAGGGGRICIRTDEISDFDTARISARGGGLDDASISEAAHGGAGTVFLGEEGRAEGDLLIDGGGRGLDAPATILASVSAGTISALGEDWFDRLEGSFDVEDVGHSIDPNALDGVFEAVEIRAVDGARAFTAPGALASAQIGGNFRGVIRVRSLRIEDAALVRIDAPLLAEDLSLVASVVTVGDPTIERTLPLVLEIDDTLEVDSASRIDLTAKGYVGGGRGGNASRRGQTADGVVASSGGRTGGCHGGLGGYQGTGTGLGTTVPPVFDDYRAPSRPGGGGSGKLDALDLGGNGGGLVLVRAREFALEGRILADGDGRQRAGNTETGGGGAGGGILLDVGILRGGGEASADGGAGDGTVGSGAGGGGRIAIYHVDRSGFTGTVHAVGGSLVPVVTRTASVGGAGTVFWKSAAQVHGDLVIDNAGRTQSMSRTLLRAMGTGTVTRLWPEAFEAAAAFPTSDTGLGGLWVVLGGDTARPFRIASNTAARVEVDPEGLDLSVLLSVGASYAGAHVLDSLTVTNRAAVNTQGDLIILTTGDLTLSGGASLASPPVIRW